MPRDSFLDEHGDVAPDESPPPCGDVMRSIDREDPPGRPPTPFDEMHSTMRESFVRRQSRANAQPEPESRRPNTPRTT